jgi:long-chain acyl-CoA synthetase
MTAGSNLEMEVVSLEAQQGCAHPQPHRSAAGQSAESVIHLGRRFVSVARSRTGQPVLTTPTAAWSYETLLTSSLTVANRLRRSPRFNAGSRVLLLFPNSLEYVAAFYGVLMAGGVCVPLSPGIERQQLERIRQSTEATHLFSQPRVLRSRKEDWKLPTDSVVLPGGNGLWEDDVSPAEVDVANVSDDALAAIFFTGGSSGTPKGVMLSHRNLVGNAQSIRRYLEIENGERPLCVLPFYHAFGNSVLQSHILAGAHLIIDGNVAFPETIVEALAKHEATSLSGVPDLFRFLLERSSLGTNRLPALRYMAVAGGMLPRALARRVAAGISPARFLVMYGQTEATARLAYLPPDRLEDLDDNCIGRAIPGVELDVVDEAGGRVRVGDVGEIRARGPNVMLGYWRDPALTGEVIRDGWLHTGDLGSVDRDGWIYHRGRRNALIKISGYRIHPAEVEEFVTRELPVEQAVLVPFDHPELGTRLALYVRRQRHAADLQTNEILARCRAELPRHMVPDLIELIDEFPLNDAMKIDRPRLTARAADAVSIRRKTA